jgi:hypothetical protein
MYRGFTPERQEVPYAYEVLDVAEALTRKYETDAHLVTYVVRGHHKQPRINKAGLEYFPHPAEVDVFFCDVDNPDHADWDKDSMEAALERYAIVEPLETAGIYLTAHGSRIVQPLAKAIPVPEVEPYLARWLGQLEEVGINVDWACRDWTRHFRLPHVIRDKGEYTSPHVDLAFMRPIELEPIENVQVYLPPAKAKKAKGKTNGAGSEATGTVGKTNAADEVLTVDWTGRPAPAPMPTFSVEWIKDVPEIWYDRIKPIAAAVREVQTEWHTLFLALSGALLGRQTPPERLPAIIRAISIATGADTKTEDRVRGAMTTVQQKQAGRQFTGYSTLKEHWPAVATAVDNCLSRGNESKLRAMARENAHLPPPPPVEESTALMQKVIRDAPDGLTLISAECGLGKTWAACDVAVENSRKEHVSERAEGVRAPLGSKTAISVDKNKLAKQVIQDIHGLDGSAKRFFGPLSLLDADGIPVCKYHDIAEPLVEGGQSMQWELCQGRGMFPCEYADGCPAKDGVEGPSDARIAVGTHGLMTKLKKHAGTTGLTIIDEPPHLLETLELKAEDFQHTLNHLYAFETRYGEAMTPAVEALRRWTERLAPLEEIVGLDTGIRRAADYLPADILDAASLAAECTSDAVMCVVHAPLSEFRSDSPPLTYAALAGAKRDWEKADNLGRASKVLHLLRRGLTMMSPVVLRVVTRHGRRVLLVTQPREQLMNTLAAAGPIVVTDANAKLHARILQKIVGYPPHFHQFSAPDGAPISRTLIRNKTATRKAWRNGTEWLVNDKLIGAVRSLFDWAKEDSSAKELAIITFKPISVLLRAVMKPESKDLEDAWLALEQKREALALAREKLGPILKSWPGTIMLAHYGALRGLNSMKGFDALATLGDPWPQVGDVQNESAFLGSTDEWKARLEDLCRAELEQAHGRLRTIHRTKPARALHVGNILPSGRAWTDGSVEIRWSKGGRPRVNDTLIPQDELRTIVQELGGQRAVGRLLKCDRMMVARYLKGQPMKKEMADRLLALHAAASPNPVA